MADLRAQLRDRTPGGIRRRAGARHPAGARWRDCSACSRRLRHRDLAAGRADGGRDGAQDAALHVVAGTIEVGMHEYDSSIAYLAAGGRAASSLACPTATGVEVEARRSASTARAGRPRRWPVGWAFLLDPRLDGDEPQPRSPRCSWRSWRCSWSSRSSSWWRPSPSSATWCSWSPRSARRSASSSRSGPPSPVHHGGVLHGRDDDRRCRHASAGCLVGLTVIWSCRTRTRSSASPATSIRSTTCR